MENINVTFTQAIVDIANMQLQYERCINANALTKHQIASICKPVQEKLHLTDLQVLRIARKEMHLADIVMLMQEKGVIHASES